MTDILTVSVDDDINVALPDRRLGLIQFSTDLLCDAALEDVLLTIFSELIPLDCKHDFISQTTRYLCLSSHFDPVPVGDLIPEYTVTVTTDPQGLKTVDFTKAGAALPSGATHLWPFPTKTSNPSAAPASSAPIGSAPGPAQDPAWSLTPPITDTITISGNLDIDLTDPTVTPDEPKKFDTIKDMFK